MSTARLITLDPGHFHAALVQKEMYPGVERRVHVYAPLGPDLLAHLGRIAGFNARPQQPTSWDLEVHAGADCLERLTREKPGNVVVLSGNNRNKIRYLLAAVEAGLHVLADKPWIIRADDMPALAKALDTAEKNGLVAYDIMTERYEITSILQRELINDAETFGTIVPGDQDQPGVFIESVHFLSKLVAGVPLRRPAWFFDIEQQGEGLTDVGTHLVDLVMWMLWPGQAIDAGRDVRILLGERWPTVMSQADFQKVTSEANFPAFLGANVKDGRLHYFCNTRVGYAVRGVQVKLDVLWDFESATGGGDTHFAVFRGSRSRVEVRQGKEQSYRPEVYVVPNRAEEAAGVRKALEHKVQQLQSHYPGIAVVAGQSEFKLDIPERYRIGHEAHFGEVTRSFLGYLAEPSRMPACEKPNMLAKYFTTTEGVRVAERSAARRG